VFEDYWNRGEPIRLKVESILQSRQLEETISSVAREIAAYGLLEESPNSVVGKSGQPHGFDLLVRNPRTGGLIGISVAKDGDEPSIRY